MDAIRKCFRAFGALSFAAFILSATVPPAAAAPGKVNTDESGLALLGYDPVAYFELSKPTRGKPSLTAEHEGATYRFVSDRHRQLFKANPTKFIPAYGGYCSFGMRYGQTSRIDPQSWEIVDGRLYLALNHGTRAVWRKSRKENITIADKLWNKIFVEN